MTTVTMGTWDNLDIYTATSLYLYGQETVPSTYEERLRTTTEYAADNPLIVKLDAVSYMQSGAGRYAHASDISFVQDFYAGTISLPPGTYTRQQLIDNHGFELEDFSVGYSQYRTDPNSSDYALRTYVFNSAGFALSADTEFKIHPNGAREITKLALLPLNDNFDFDTDADNISGVLLQQGNENILEPGVDPYGIGQRFDIQWLNKDSVPRITNYNYLQDMADAANVPIVSVGSGVASALSAMLDVVDALKQAGTIDYDNGDGVIGYGTTENDYEVGTVYGDIIVSGDGNDQLFGDAGGDYLYGGAGNDSLTGGANNDYLHGGSGIDTAIFSGNYNQYSIISGSTNMIVTDTVTNRHGTDTLVQVERIEFADGIYENGVFTKDSLQKPVADDDTASVSVNGSVNIVVLSNDHDPDKQAMTISLGTQAAHGTATLNLNGTFTYVPDTNFAGFDSFTYTLTDADSLTTTATVYVAVGGNIVSGTSGNDSSLNGSNSADVILGLAGNDTITALDGDDIVYGDAGADTIYGGNGADTIYGGDNNDHLYGGAGNDTLNGGAGNDNFYADSGTDMYYGGSGSDQFHFDMSVDTGWVGVNENDAQGSDVIYFTNATSGNRIEFYYNAGQLNGYWFETELGGYDFSFAISSTNALAGTGVEYISIDGRSYSTKNIIAAADAAAGNVFVFDIDEYKTTGYPAILSDGTNATAYPVQSGSGGLSIYRDYNSTNSIYTLRYADESFHAIIADGSAPPDNIAMSNGASAIMYIKNFYLHSGFNAENTRLTVNNSDNAAITIHLDDVDVSYTYNYFEDGFYVTGYSVSSSSYSNIGTVTGNNSYSLTIYGEDVAFDASASYHYYFENIIFANGDTVNLRGVIDFEGTETGETLYGIDRADIIHGYGGNDVINSRSGNDTVYGGAGDDALYGGLGDDTYIYHEGDGQDTINENLSEGIDTVEFGGGISSTDVYSWVDQYGDLTIQLKSNANDRVIIAAPNATSSGATVGAYVEQVIFSGDGVVWDLTTGLIMHDTSDAHNLNGSAQNDIINGNGGNDTIYGYNGNDSISGGTDNDSLYGGVGDDTYIFTIGDDQDTVNEDLSEGTDTVHFIDGISSTDVYSWVDQYGDLTIQLKSNANDRVIIAAPNATSSGATVGAYVEQVIFSGDGVVWDLTTGLIMHDTSDAHNLNGSAQNDIINGNGGNDTIYGYNGNDSISGGTDNDSLYGGVGDDTYIFTIGDDQDTVNEDLSGGTDTVHFIDGISSTDVYSWVDQYGDLTIQLKSDANDKIIIATPNPSSSGSTVSSYVEQISFSGDGVVWDMTSGLIMNDTDDAHNLNGSAQADTIYAAGGADIVYGYGGNDTISGGAGDDTSLQGGLGDDTYVFAADSDVDNITENLSEGTDTVFFAGGISSTDVYSWTDQYGDLFIQLKSDSSDRVIIAAPNPSSTGSSVSSYVERISFSGDSVVWDLTAGLILNDSNDTHYIHASAQNDFINGGGGGDYLYGYGGNDTYILEYGYGADTISESTGAGTDVIRIVGIDADDIRIWTDTSGRLHIQNKNNISDEAVVHATTTNTGGTYQSLIGQYVESIVFDDETIWDLTAGLTMEGSSSYETIYGTTYNDTIFGYGNSDSLYGNSGNDTLVGGTGDDYLYGGVGNDTYVLASGYGADTISESTSSGTDIIRLTGVSATDIRLWTDTNGYLHLQNKNNLSDHVTVYAAHSGGTYQSTIGQYVESVVFDDTTTWDLTGGLTIEGSSSSESLYGTAGGDIINGQAGSDTLYGNAGNDTYVLGVWFGTDSIYESTSSGTDTIRLTGVTAADIRLWTDNNGYLHLQNKTSAGDHVTVYAGYSGGQYQSIIGQYVESVVFDNTTTWDLTGGLTIEGSSSVESLYGTTYNDTLYGYDGGDTLYGNNGNDILIGGVGNDTLNAGAGNDTYMLGYGFGGDTISESTSSGTDTIRLTGVSATDIRLWTDNNGYLHLQNKTNLSDHVTVNAYYSGGQYQSTIGQYVESVVFDDTTIWDLTGGLTIEGSSSNESLYGTAHGDTMYGQDGTDYIYANAGNDILYGGNGSDYLYGGSGDDTYMLAAGFGTDTISENTSSGSDIIRLTGVSAADIRLWTDYNGYLHLQNKTNLSDHVTVNASYSGGSYQSTIGQYVESVVFDDTTTWDLTGGLVIEGSSSSDSLYGTAYNDNISGQDGVDYIYGNAGNDIMYGGASGDYLYGGDGTDYLYGGAGADNLTGNAGADRFIFESAHSYSAIDAVSDFSTAQGDSLDLVNLLGDYDPLTDAITDFVLMQTSGSNTNVSVDRDGTGSTYGWIQVATLTGVTGLTDEAALVTNGNLLVA